MLKALMLRKKIDEARTALKELEESGKGFKAREAELEQSIEEATTEEENETVEKAIDELEAEKKELEEKKQDLSKTVRDLEKELEELEGQQEPAPESGKEERKEERKMQTAVNAMAGNERERIFQSPEAVAFLDQVREMHSRANIGSVANATLLIPEIMLPMLRQVVEENTKLLKHVNHPVIPGTGRMVIDGGFPEAVWTEMYKTLNEVNIGFSDIEVDGYKLGAFVRIHNELLEDSNINLGSEIITKLGQGIGYALDKAILYGTGTKMPLGVVTRLAQTAEPEDYPATARAWKDLHTSNVLKIKADDSTGINLYRNLVRSFGAARNRFTKGAKFWAMNENTMTTLIVEAMNFNAAGAIVTGMSQIMPIIGGAIETLDFIPDNVIIGGYEQGYLLAVRHGVQFGQSEHRYFIEEQTLFKGTARYDGKPVIPEGFVAIGINGTTVSPTAVTFAADTANP